MISCVVSLNSEDPDHIFSGGMGAGKLSEVLYVWFHWQEACSLRYCSICCFLMVVKRYSMSFKQRIHLYMHLKIPEANQRCWWPDLSNSGWWSCKFSMSPSHLIPWVDITLITASQTAAQAVWKPFLLEGFPLCLVFFQKFPPKKVGINMNQPGWQQSITPLKTVLGMFFGASKNQTFQRCLDVGSGKLGVIWKKNNRFRSRTT